MGENSKKTLEDLRNDIQEQIEKVRKQDIGLDADSSSLDTDVYSNDDPDDESAEQPFGSPIDEK